jgi:hypothetical protein
LCGSQGELKRPDHLYKLGYFVSPYQVLKRLLHHKKKTLQLKLSMCAVFQANWYTAQRDCRSKGLELASVYNVKENDAIVKAIGKCSKLINTTLYTKIGFSK